MQMSYGVHHVDEVYCIADVICCIDDDDDRWSPLITHNEHNQLTGTTSWVTMIDDTTANDNEDEVTTWLWYWSVTLLDVPMHGDDCIDDDDDGWSPH